MNNSPARLCEIAEMHRLEVPVEQIRVGDMHEVGNDYISRVRSIEPYWMGRAPMRIDHRYLVVNGVYPPKAKNTIVAVWRP